MEQTESAIFDMEEAQLMLASGIKRFFNNIIDNTAYYAFAKIYNLFIARLYFEAYYEALHFNLTLIILIDTLISLCLYVLFLTGMETIFKGKTLGKLLTGTRAVLEDGSQITFRKAILRGLVRIIPFEFLSAFGSPSYPWHDRWTHTYVIDEKQSFYPETFREN